MTSIIKNAASLGITYTASSLSLLGSGYKPENVFTDNDSPYFMSSNNAPNQWWQVSFSKEVAISRYIIRTSASYTYRPISWRILASNDNVSWKTVHTVEGKETAGNKDWFYPSNTIHCIHFRIVVDRCSDPNSYYVAFTYFDCIGELSPAQTNKAKHPCNTGSKQCLVSFHTYILSLVNFIT